MDLSWHNIRWRTMVGLLPHHTALGWLQKFPSLLWSGEWGYQSALGYLVPTGGPLGASGCLQACGPSGRLGAFRLVALRHYGGHMGLCAGSIVPYGPYRDRMGPYRIGVYI